MKYLSSIILASANLLRIKFATNLPKNLIVISPGRIRIVPKVL